MESKCRIQVPGRARMAQPWSWPRIGRQRELRTRGLRSGICQSADRLSPSAVDVHLAEFLIRDSTRCRCHQKAPDYSIISTRRAHLYNIHIYRLIMFVDQRLIISTAYLAHGTLHNATPISNIKGESFIEWGSTELCQYIFQNGSEKKPSFCSSQENQW